jgi:glycerophosphoryl diester phosphodiesterase
MNVLLDLGARPVIGHRGNRAHAPENTIESFAQAVSAGADALELDVHLSADGIPVVIHDPNTARTTGAEGEVSRMSFADLRLLDAGSCFTRDGGKTFPYRAQGHRIPSLDEVFEAFPSMPILIEIKTSRAASAVRSVIELRKAEGRTLVDSFDPDALSTFADSQIPVGASQQDVLRATIEVVFHRPVTPFTFRAFCIPLNHRGIPLPVRRLARIAPRQNCVVHVWTVNDPEIAKDLWTAGVRGIIRDDPAAMIQARAQLPGGATY